MTTLLQQPNFIDRNPAAVEAEMVSTYEAATAKTLYPAQLERLLIHEWAYRETQLRIAFQQAALQNLLNWATGPFLDELGAFLACARVSAVPAAGAGVTLAAASPPPEGVAVLAGFRVSPPGGRVVFATTQSVVLTQAEPSAAVPVVCLEHGGIGNGYAAGAWEFVDQMPYLTSVTNTAITAGGVDEEDDDHYREAIRIAPQAWATGGTRVAYRYHAMRVSAAVLDAVVLAWGDDATIPEGTVRVYMLAEPQLLGTAEGDAQAEQLRRAVQDKLRQDDIRALCDTVDAVLVTVHTVAAQVAIKYYADAAVEDVQASVVPAVAAFAGVVVRKLGKDLVAEQVEGACMGVAGVYAATVTFTGGTPATIGKTAVYRMFPVTYTYTMVTDTIQ